MRTVERPKPEGYFDTRKARAISKSGRHAVFRGLDWTGLDWTSKTRTSKTRTSKARTSKARTSKTRTGKTRTGKTRTNKTQKNVGFINTIIYYSKNV